MITSRTKTEKVEKTSRQALCQGRVQRKPLLALAATVFCGILAFSAIGAGAATVEVGGPFTYAAAIALHCPPGTVFCTNGEFGGSLAGPFTNVVTSLIPSPNLGVTFFSGSITLRTPAGNLRCGLSGALNLGDKDGEFGEICVVNGGTGIYRGAKGHLELTGSSTDTPPIVGDKGAGSYTGTITGPAIPSSN